MNNTNLNYSLKGLKRAFGEEIEAINPELLTFLDNLEDQSPISEICTILQGLREAYVCGIHDFDENELNDKIDLIDKHLKELRTIEKQLRDHFYDWNNWDK